MGHGLIYDRVVIFDYDGVITDGNPMAVQSMRKALQTVLVDNGYEYSEENFLQATADTTGTTELSFIRRCLEQLNIDSSNQFILLDEYIEHRASILRESNKERGVHKSDEGYINLDFMELTRRLKQSDAKEGIRTYYAIATGNPGWVMDERLPEEVRAIFDSVHGGQMGTNRKDIVQDLLNNLFVEGRISKQQTRFYYVDDSSRAVLSVAEREPAFPQRHWYDIYPIHIDRKNQPSPQILELEKQGLAFCVRDLRDSSLMSFLNPRIHRPVEGSYRLPSRSRK